MNNSSLNNPGHESATPDGENTVIQAPACPDAPQESAPKKKGLFQKIPKPALIGGIIAVAVIIIVIIANIPVPVEKIELEEDSIQMDVGDLELLSYTVYPSKADGLGYEWSSSDENVATVSGDGAVTAVGSGKCEITVEIDGVEAKVDVFVLPDLRAVYSEHCNSYWATLGRDGSYLEIDTNPSDRDDYSNSEAVAAVIAVNTALDLPDSLINSMSSTTALMGRQSETFDELGLKVEWSYHPDNGLEVSYRVIK